ncbi:MAG: hypothetical protein FWG05_03635 [Kiritimatiellaeota bacterium]|nr:hypothetical protein [Kiritimatiellota bacterium]
MSSKTPPDTDALFAAGEVRGRERRRYTAMPVWGIVSFATHCVIIAALIWFTPLREIIIPDRANKPYEKLELDPDKLEKLAQDLQSIRLNELLRQLEDLQSIYYNMEMMKNDILKDYDAFAEQQEGTVRELVSQSIGRVILEQEKTVAEQKVAQVSANVISELQVRDITDTNVTQKITHEHNVYNNTVPAIDSAQANAQNLLDKVSVEAELIGLVKTAEAAVTLRDVQLDANTMQRETRRNLANRTSAIVTEYPRATAAVATHAATVERNEANRLAVTERLAAQKKAAEDHAREAAELQKTLDRLAAEHKAAREAADKAQEKLDALTAPPPAEEV